MSSKVLIIAGMHRSGTSLVSQWLYRCGLFIGGRLVPPAIGNSEGHFEDADFLELHERLLRDRGLPSSGFTARRVLNLSTHEREEVHAMLEEKSSQHDEWGWKEPRTCLFLADYKQLLPSAHYLVVVRNFNETVNSMLSREHTAFRSRFRKKQGWRRIWWMIFKNRSREQTFQKYASRYLEIWIRYYEAILDHIVTLPPNQYMVICYQYLASRDRQVFDQLTNSWQYKLNYVAFKDVFKRELLSETIDISPFVKKPGLVERAKRIDRMIAQLMDT